MLIKTVTSKGEAVPHDPKEALSTALLYGLKKQSSQARIYWVRRDTVVGDVAFVKDETNKSYTATATGTAMVGYTDAATDTFYDAKPYNFSIGYHSVKDSLGLPDIAIDKFEMGPVNQDPAALMNFPDLTIPSPLLEEKITVKSKK